MAMSWERLEALAAAHTRNQCATMLQFMVGAQGNEKAWQDQQRRLLDELRK